MGKSAYRHLVGLFVAAGCLTMITGCEAAMNPASPVDLSTPSTDLAMFIQQFAREALAAILF